ncbi:hypothetical protein F8M41_016702 [Gigaspora margarita]|uniref:Zn(2)-C6 fungal-type domain-containing protein n=1 Tax=Gigaspora margarita TaxID=4874 RepID=A0A8H4EMP9_GIGMA|nr:hypothetical protein F8M41_016702 [Gigaspora margarita]
MDTKKKRNLRSCDSCRKDKKGCSGGENGVRSCERCGKKEIDCSYIGEFIPLRGHCEDHLEYENANGDTSNSQNLLDELPSNGNILYSPTGLVDYCGSSEYYGFVNMADSPHNVSQTNIPQEHIDNAGLIKECLNQGSKIVHRLTHLVLLEHRYPQSLTSPALNEHLKNLLMTLQSQSSQLEELFDEQTNNLEPSSLNQSSGQYWTTSQDLTNLPMDSNTQ